MSYKTISIVGLGYIGLPTAAVFASRKIKVIGLDVSAHVVDTVNRGEIHIIEPDLDMVVNATVAEGYLRATLEAQPSDAFLIAVPTPFRKGSNGSEHEPDLSYIEAAAKSIAPVLHSGNLVVLESTSPVGATQQMELWLAEMRPDLTFPHTHGEDSDIRIAHCPERVLPGHVLRELVENDRIIGGMTPRCSEAATSLYKIFVKGDCIITDARTAEMCKLTENSFRDVNIAFANELSMICEELDINVWELIKLANRHPRVNILTPGPGVGGHCIAVDPWFIVNSAPDQAKLVRKAREVNTFKPEWAMLQLHRKIDAVIEEKGLMSEKDLTIAFYGIAFKPNIDDLRESPSLQIVEKMAKRFGGTIQLVEPNIDQLPTSLTGMQLMSPDEVDANIRVFLVKHSQFKGIQFDETTDLDLCGMSDQSV